jgi:hypothetical protein
MLGGDLLALGEDLGIGALLGVHLVFLIRVCSRSTDLQWRSAHGWSGLLIGQSSFGMGFALILTALPTKNQKRNN